MKKNGFIIGLLFLTSMQLHANTFVSEDVITEPTPQRFSICFNTTCETVQELSLQQQQWKKVQQLFQRSIDSAAIEREVIKRAIALLEDMVGRLAGTSNDLAENAGGAREGQMDCIDESTNTTIYLTMMQSEGLLKFHQVSDIATRGYFITGWPHSSAVIKETASSQFYVVDSWFLHNGEQPYIIPLTEWQNGWRPG